MALGGAWPLRTLSDGRFLTSGESEGKARRGSERGGHGQTCTPTAARPVQGRRWAAQPEDKGRWA